jgi:hypothetical protein
MEELVDLITGQPLGIALALIWIVMFQLEKIVSGATYKRALDTIAEQQKTIDDLRATAKANTEAARLSLDFIKGFDDRLRKEDEDG